MGGTRNEYELNTGRRSAATIVIHSRLIFVDTSRRHRPLYALTNRSSLQHCACVQQQSPSARFFSV